MSKLEKWFDLKTSVVLSFLVLNTVVMAWVAFGRKQDLPTNYISFLGIVWGGATFHGVSKVMKGTDNNVISKINE